MIKQPLRNTFHLHQQGTSPIWYVAQKLLRSRCSLALTACCLVTLALSLPANAAMTGAVDPRYAVTLHVEADGVVTGTETVEFHNKSAGALTTVWLRLWANRDADGPGEACQKPVIRVTAVAGGLPVNVASNHCSVLQIQLTHPLAQNDSAAVTVHFTIHPPLDGEYFPVIRSLARVKDGPLLYGGALPTLAPQDETGVYLAAPEYFSDRVYALPGIWDATIYAPGNLKLFASGQTISSRKTHSGQTRLITHIDQAPDFAFAAGKFVTRSVATVDGTKINYVHSPYSTRDLPHNMRRDDRDQLLVAREAVRIYSERYGPIQTKEIDIVNPGGPVRASYPGLMIGYAGGTSIATGIAEQWWGNTVGVNEVADPWFQDTMTSYAAVDCFRSSSAAFAADVRLDGAVDYRTPIPELLGLEPYRTDHSRRFPNSHALERLQASFLTGIDTRADLQQKSGLLFSLKPIDLDHFRHQVGKPALDRFLRELLNANRHTTLTTKIFIDTLRQTIPNQKAVDELLERVKTV